MFWAGTLWVQGNLRGVFEALKKTHDQGVRTAARCSCCSFSRVMQVIVDFLKAAEESLKKSNSLTLDIARGTPFQPDWPFSTARSVQI